MNDSRLLEFRDRIEATTHELVALLNRRYEISQAIGEEKRRFGLSQRDLQRERTLIERLVAKSSGPMPAEAIQTIIQSVFDASLAAANADEKSFTRS